MMTRTPSSAIRRSSAQPPVVAAGVVEPGEVAGCVEAVAGRGVPDSSTPAGPAGVSFASMVGLDSI